ncbi:Hypothetical predicted protein [Marmota monax]|uniref:Uncharacterized protein n=1 Tax=Marmota monax TaxID=9995 RepID=A0A5E4BQ33_MARMO|nr:hypothetical protein GHT09_009873 [Marmota monax]VTJ71170.1 Hypothetical predicted protein [Marmota monax]
MEVPAAATESPADQALQPPGVLWRRGCLRGLRGALPSDLRREAAELAALAGPVVSAAAPRCARPTAAAAAVARLGRSLGLL